jgi:hypothetical protein
MGYSMRQTLLLVFFLVIVTTCCLGQSSGADRHHYLSWTSEQAVNIGKAMRVNGKVGSSWDFRVTNTDHAVNYKLRATLLTPEVIRAAARLEQLRNRLTDDQTRTLVAEADAAGDIVILVEIDPREGSGVIPLDWRVFLQPRGEKPGSPFSIPGLKSPQLRNLKSLSGVMRRDYDYDLFWIVFPLIENNASLLSPDVSEIELVVGIYNREGRVNWRLPESVREKINARLRKQL